MLDRIEAITGFGDAFVQFLIVTLLCSIRLFAVFSIFQATSEQAIQGRIRSGFILMIAGLVAVGQPADFLSHFEGINLFILPAKEAGIGVFIGYLCATVFWVAEGVGALIDNVAGYNNVQQQNPLSTAQSTPISAILLQLSITLFYTLGGFLFLLDALFETYRLWPVDSSFPVKPEFIREFVIVQTDSLMTQIVKIVSPVLLIMVLIDLGFGLVAKTAGKLEPNSLAQPVKSAVAILIVLLSLSLFVQQLQVKITLNDLKAQLQSWAAVTNKRP